MIPPADNCPADGILELGDIVVLKHESGPVSGLRIELMYGIGESAGSSNNRHGTVVHAVHLVQTAWLVFRGHEEDIGAGFGKVRQPVVIAEADACGAA